MQPKWLEDPRAAIRWAGIRDRPPPRLATLIAPPRYALGARWDECKPFGIEGEKDAVPPVNAGENLAPRTLRVGKPGPEPLEECPGIGVDSLPGQHPLEIVQPPVLSLRRKPGEDAVVAAMFANPRRHVPGGEDRIGDVYVLRQPHGRRRSKGVEQNTNEVQGLFLRKAKDFEVPRQARGTRECDRQLCQPNAI